MEEVLPLESCSVVAGQRNRLEPTILRSKSLRPEATASAPTRVQAAASAETRGNAHFGFPHSNISDTTSCDHFWVQTHIGKCNQVEV